MTAFWSDWSVPLCAAWLDAGIALYVAGLLFGTSAARRAGIAGLIGAALAGYIAVSTTVMTDATPADFPNALSLVLRQTHFGAMQLVALTAWICLLLGGRQRMLAWLAALTLVAARAATGHAADAGVLTPALIAHVLHLSGMAIWAGTVWLAGLANAEDPGTEMLAQQVSTLATWALGLIVLTGLWNLERVTHGAPTRASPDYLRWLWAKGALIAGAVGLGALNRWRYLPGVMRRDPQAKRYFWRILRVEGLLLAAVVIVAARLAVTMAD